VEDRRPLVDERSDRLGVILRDEARHLERRRQIEAGQERLLDLLVDGDLRPLDGERRLCGDPIGPAARRHPERVRGTHLGSHPEPHRPGATSHCEAYRKTIVAKLEQGLSAKRIHQDLRADHGFEGSYYSVRRFVKRLATKTPLPLRRIETAPGEEAQIDFGTGPELVDVETGAETDLILNAERINQYKERLQRLQTSLARACRRGHAPFVTLVAEKGLPGVCHDELCQSGILRVD